MIWYAMKQYDLDRKYPDSIKEREKIIASRSTKNKQKQSKKMSVRALAGWHNISNIENMLKTPTKQTK
jgi:hypothetical protein